MTYSQAYSQAREELKQVDRYASAIINTNWAEAEAINIIKMLDNDATLQNIRKYVLFKYDSFTVSEKIDRTIKHLRMFDIVDSENRVFFVKNENYVPEPPELTKNEGFILGGIIPATAQQARCLKCSDVLESFEDARIILNKLVCAECYREYLERRYRIEVKEVYTDGLQRDM